MEVAIASRLDGRDNILTRQTDRERFEEATKPSPLRAPHVPIPFNHSFIHPSIHSFLSLPLPEHIRHAAAEDISHAQAHGGAAHDAPRAELGGESLFPPAGDDEVGGAPGGGDAGRVGGVAVDVQVRGEEQDWGKEHGEFLQGPEVLGCY